MSSRRPPIAPAACPPCAPVIYLSCPTLILDAPSSCVSLATLTHDRGGNGPWFYVSLHCPTWYLNFLDQNYIGLEPDSFMAHLLDYLSQIWWLFTTPTHTGQAPAAYRIRWLFRLQNGGPRLKGAPPLVRLFRPIILSSVQLEVVIWGTSWKLFCEHVRNQRGACEVFFFFPLLMHAWMFELSTTAWQVHVRSFFFPLLMHACMYVRACCMLLLFLCACLLAGVQR